MINIKLINIPKELVIRAIQLAYIFDEEYPDRMGIYHGCGYGTGNNDTLYVYRTKTMIVVRKE